MASQDSWAEQNQSYLTAALARVRAALQNHLGESAKAASSQAPPADATAEGWPDTVCPPALERLTQIFGLSTFEQSILLLCAGVELESAFAALCARAQGDPARPYPTFSLALAALPDPHWSAITPAGSLRRWRLIEVQSLPNVALTNSPLRIDERILHFLTGIQHLDERLQGLLEPVALEDLVPSHRELAGRIAATWLAAGSPANGKGLPLIQLCGPDVAAKHVIAAAACAEIGLRLFALPAQTVPASAAELEALARLWEREAALSSSALCVTADTLERSDGRAAAQVSHFLERIGGPVLLTTREPWHPIRRAVRTFDATKPTAEEQIAIWQELLRNAGVSVNGCVNDLVAQFNLSRSAIRASVQEAVSVPADTPGLAVRLWEAGRAQARPRLEDLAQRIVPAATWDNLVLPEPEMAMLREVAAQVAHRTTVYHKWGFARLGNRGLGISALFAGSSGTGKTMAAEVLAHQLRLDLYRIDLSSVVSKYIGETEKNLRRVFDAAEDGGAILFFDEADALFGKRSEVKDSHDRYANIEINYLLQRMESYCGLSVLATNMKSSLDAAFTRRIRFIINFPFPNAALRAAIWERIFPPRTPLEGLDIAQLSKLNLAGGNIRNIAMNAAFLAASAQQPVRMPHIWRAARTEYAKMERPLTEVEIRDWQ
jgi:hypothetical protein